MALGYVSHQLGHADLAITAQHYARWCGGEEYRDPMRRQPSEVPADFLARLDSPHSPPTSAAPEAEWTQEAERVRGVDGWSSGSALVGRTGLEPVTSAV